MEKIFIAQDTFSPLNLEQGRASPIPGWGQNYMSKRGAKRKSCVKTRGVG
jgi:hypothetical protein